MNPHALTLVAFGLVLVPGSALLAPGGEKQERAMAEIQKAKGGPWLMRNVRVSR